MDFMTFHVGFKVFTFYMQEAAACSSMYCLPPRGKCPGAQKLAIGLRAVDPQRRHIIQEKFLPLDGGSDLCWCEFEF